MENTTLIHSIGWWIYLSSSGNVLFFCKIQIYADLPEHPSSARTSQTAPEETVGSPKIGHFPIGFYHSRVSWE